MAIRHVVTIQVAPGKSASFASAFKPLQAVAQQEEGCQQYERIAAIPPGSGAVPTTRLNECGAALARS